MMSSLRWSIVCLLVGCGGENRTPPTQPEAPRLDAGETTPTDPGTDTGEPLGPIAAGPSGGLGGAGASGGLAGIGGLGGVAGRDPIAR
jgi:hypothetical protein